MTDTPLWRQAIQDKSHALHQAAWLIFTTDIISFKLADRQLSAKREAVIAFCLAILDADELYTTNAPSKGYAPANAARLLGHWQVTEALPRLLHILRYEAIETLAYTGTSEGLIEMGEAAVPALLDLGSSYSRMDDSPELPLTISGILSRIGKGKPEVFTYMQQVFRSILPDEGAYEYMAELFIEWDGAQGRAYLEECLKQSHFRHRYKMIRRVLQNFTPDA